jgi:hypothetical protein
MEVIVTKNETTATYVLVADGIAYIIMKRTEYL